MTLSITIVNAALGINDTQYKDITIKKWDTQRNDTHSRQP
jgi:hypothetical protein